MCIHSFIKNQLSYNPYKMWQNGAKNTTLTLENWFQFRQWHGRIVYERSVKITFAKLERRK